MVIRPRLARPVFALCTLATCAAPLAAQRWQMQYLYGEAKSALSIVDIQCPSASRCVAAGVITQGGRVKFVALVTSDGGAHWRTVTLKERPLSLFFLNEGFGWMVTEKGLWRTAEAGKSWTKLPNVRAPELGGSISLNAKGLHMLHNARAPVLRVLFAGENNGWAVCGNKTVLKTHDGARHWSSVRAAAFRVARTRHHRRRQYLEVRPRFHLRRNHPRPLRRGRHGARPHRARSASDVWVTLRGVYYLAGVMAAGRSRRGPLAGHRQRHDSEAGVLNR